MINTAPAYSRRAHLLIVGVAVSMTVSAFVAAWAAANVYLFWWFIVSGFVLAGASSYYFATLALDLDPRHPRTHVPVEPTNGP